MTARGLSWGQSLGWGMLLLLLVVGASALAHPPHEHTDKFDQKDKFRQLEELLPTPNAYRNASGAPGHEYWQQRADYEIDVEIDDENQRLIGSERITYHNNSPDTLTYLWVAIDNNIFAEYADSI